MNQPDKIRDRRKARVEAMTAASFWKRHLGICPSLPTGYGRRTPLLTDPDVAAQIRADRENYPEGETDA